MATIKFSEFDAGNINAGGAQIVGLEGGVNKRFTASDLVNGLATQVYVDAQDLNLQNQITQNANDIANIDIDVGNIEVDTSEIEANIAILQGNVTVLEGAVAALETNVTVNTDDITVIRGNIVAIENELANIADTDAQTLTWDGATANLSISNGNNVILQEVLDNAGNITVMQGQIADLQANGNIQTLSLDNSSNVLSISGGNSVDFTTMLGNVAGSGDTDVFGTTISISNTSTDVYNRNGVLPADPKGMAVADPNGKSGWYWQSPGPTANPSGLNSFQWKMFNNDGPQTFTVADIDYIYMIVDLYTVGQVYFNVYTAGVNPAPTAFQSRFSFTLNGDFASTGRFLMWAKPPGSSITVDDVEVYPFLERLELPYDAAASSGTLLTSEVIKSVNVQTRTSPALTAGEVEFNLKAVGYKVNNNYIQNFDMEIYGGDQSLTLDNSSNVLTISGSAGNNTVDFTTVLGNVAGGGGLPANVNITTEDITLSVTSNADLADLQNVIATYRLTSSLDQDGSREHAPIIYVDVSPGNYAVGGYFSIEHMTPNVRFRSNGGDRTDTIIVFNAQVNIIDSTVRFDGIDVRFPNWINVTDNSWLGLGMSTAINFEADYFTIVRGAYAESKNVTFGYTYTELSQNGMFWSGSGSNWAGTASDWWLLDTSKVHLEGSGGTNLFDFNDVYVAMQSKFYARHTGGVTVTCGDITLDDQSQAYIRSSSGTIDCVDVDVFDTSDLHLEATTVNASGDIRLFHQSRLACTGAFNVTGSVNLFETSMLTADNLTVAGSNNLNIFEGSQVVVEDRCTAPFIDMEGGTLTAVGSSASSDGDIYTQSLTVDFGSQVAAKNDIAPSSGSTTVEVNLMDSKLVANRILNAGQVNLISSDLRSEDGIQFDETNGFLQAFGSYIGLNGPISQLGFTAASNGIYLEGSILMSDSTITCSYFDLNASKMITSSTLTVNGISGPSSEIDLFLGSEVHCSSLRKTNTFDTNNFLYARIDNGSTLHISGQLGATTGDGPTLTANIELNHGSKCFIEDNSASNNIGNCNIVVQNFSEFFSPLGRVSDYL